MNRDGLRKYSVNMHAAVSFLSFVRNIADDLSLMDRVARCSAVGRTVLFFSFQSWCNPKPGANLS